MACACKVNQEIDRISKYYSYNRKTDQDNHRMGINKKDAALTLFIYLLLLPLIPIMFIGILVYGLFSKSGKISLRKVLGFIHKTKDGRK